METHMEPDACRLVKPDESMLKEIESYRAEFLAAGDSLDGTGAAAAHGECGGVVAVQQRRGRPR